MLGESIDKILTELSSNRAGSAWKAFLRTYSTVIMQVVYQYASDKNRADECFLFVCEKLSDDGFRRLLKFETHRKVRFSTWLKFVVSNLCVDWHRKEFGRQRPYRAIAKLSEFDQLLYKYRVKYGMTLLTCFYALQLSYPELTKNQMAESLNRLHNTLTPRQRWQLSVRKRETGSAIVTDAFGDRPMETNLIETDPGPETVVQLHQSWEELEKAMSKLSNQQRLLLRLRYQEDLPLKEVANLAGLGDLHQAKRRVKGALKTLSELLVTDKTAE